VYGWHGGILTCRRHHKSKWKQVYGGGGGVGDGRGRGTGRGRVSPWRLVIFEKGGV
jgi:hypothetical protein